MTKKSREADHVMKSRKKSTSADAKTKVRRKVKVTTDEVAKLNVSQEQIRLDASALARERDILKGIMENTGTMMAYLDSDFNFVAVNSAYAKGARHSVEELIGKNHFVLFPNAENQTIFERVRSTGEPVTFFDKPFVFADQPERGTTFWDWTLAPVKDKGGRVQGLVLSLFETTQRKRAEEDIKALSRFPSENPNPIMRLSKDGIVLYCNNAGLPVLSRWKSEVGQPASFTWCQLVADVFRSGTKREFEEEHGTRTFSFVLSPIGEAGYVNVYGMDVTERKKAEEALRKVHDELEIRVDDRTTELQVEINERKRAEERVRAERKHFIDILEELPAYLVLLTPDYHVSYANRFFRERFGEDHGQHCFEYLFGRTQPCETCETYKTLKTMAPLEWEWTGPDRRNYHIYDSPFTDIDGSTLIMEVGIDVTELKKAQVEAQVRANQQSVAAQLGQRALRGGDLDELFNEAVKRVAQTLDVEYCKVLELLPDEKELLLRAGVGWKDELVGRAKVGTGTDSQAGYTLLSHEPVVVEDLRTEKRFSGTLLLHEHSVVSGMSVIISSHDKPFGVLGAHTTKRRTFTEYDINFLQAVANILSTAIERKQSEEKLRAVSLYSRSLLEASLDPLVTISAEGKITDVNKATEEATGFSREQLIGSDFSDYFTDPEEARKGYRRVFTEGFVTDYPLAIRHKSGKVTDVLYTATVYKNENGEIQGVFAAARDITERKKAQEALLKAHDELEMRVEERTRELQAQINERMLAEKALRESERDLNRAQAVAKTGSWRLDLRRNELLWSDETYRIFEIPKGTPMTYEAFLSAVHPDDREHVDQKWKTALQGEPYDIEHRIIANGETKWVREKAELELDENINGLVGGFGTVQDITELKQAEQALYQAKQEWERTFDSVPDLIAIVDDQYRIVRANKAMAQQLGKEPEQCIGLFCYECVHGLNHPIESCPHVETLKDGQQHIQELHEDRLGGDFLVSTTPLRDEQMHMIGSVHVARNITERKKMEAKLEQYAKHLEDLVEEKTKQLKEAERLATIGQTAAMVGHDIRNPLQSVEGATYLAKEELKSLPAESRQRQELEEMLTLIEKQTDYIDHIVSDLQDFSRTPMPQPREVDTQDLIVESLATIDIPDNIEVQTTLEEDLPPLIVDPTYIKRVLLNLIENAVQAMPNGGKLTVKAFRDEESTCMCVEDTGVGIAEENKSKIFAPLFTTRAKGQGFGLSVCKKLVEAHNGTITFESEVGKGTRFMVKLPLGKKANQG